MVIIAALVIGGLCGAALGRVTGHRTGAAVGAVISASACLVYAYFLNTRLLVPTAAVSSALTAIAAVLAGLQGGLFYAPPCR
jgi:hypothetical protein